MGMVVLLAFSITLLVAVFLSGLAERSVLSAALIFLVAGFVMGNGMFGLISTQPEDPLVATLAELALFGVLFTDGMRIGSHDLRSAWRLPGRALLFGLPLTLVGTALLARGLAGLSWADSLLVGAVLSPTDPVLSAAMIGHKRVPFRLRHLLNVESGLNDGLALPLILVLLKSAGGTDVTIPVVLAELTLGVALGVLVPWLVLRLQLVRSFSPATAYQPLNAFSLGLLILALASLTQANLFLAAFTAGITIATVRPAVRDAFHQFGDLVTELLKVSALFIFGTLISPAVLGTEFDASDYGFVLLSLIAVRPIALGIALLGSRIGWREWTAAAWFGPKGFSSMTFGLLILKTGIPHAMQLFHLVAMVITGSIIVHSSTDVPVARWFHEEQKQESNPPGTE